MDEIARRREARMQKILQNSHNRLQKITQLTGIGAPDPAEITTEQQAVEVNHEYVAPELSHLTPDIPTAIVENPIVTSGNVKRPSNDPNKIHKVHTIVVVGMALFVNIHLSLFSEFFQVDLSETNFNKIFIPLFAYDLIYYYFDSDSDQGSDDSKQGGLVLQMLLLNQMGGRNVNQLQAKKMFRIVNVLMLILQDLMVYFFTFAASELLLNAMKAVF